MGGVEARSKQIHRKLLVLLFFILLLLTAGSTFVSAACHVVTPSGSGSQSGADWNNAFADIPATLTRGDTYYIATGTYPHHRFNTPESGTALITIKKAIATDHCTDVGWNNATMGVGQAVWTTTGGQEIWQFLNNGFWVLDGNGRTDRKSGHGFKLDNSNVSAATRNVLHIQTSPGTPLNNFTFRYIEVQGAGTRSNTDHGGPLNFSEHNVDFGGITNNILFEYGYIHDSSNIPVQLSGSLGQSGRAHDITFQYTTIARDASGSSFHGNGFYDQGNYDNITFRYGVLEDLEGTAWMGSNVAGGTTTNYAIYGNVFVVHSGNPHGVTGIGNGAIAIYNAKTVNGFFVYNNSFVNLQPNSSRVYIGPEVTVSNVQIRNNLWYNTADASHGPNTTGMTASHNYYINTPFNISLETDVQTAAGSPLVDWVNENFHLSAPTIGGLTLSAPYNIDPDGSTRGAGGLWNRGAYEFLSLSRPAPPTNLRLVP